MRLNRGRFFRIEENLGSQLALTVAPPARAPP
jgi:hypothetical protein